MSLTPYKVWSLVTGLRGGDAFRQDVLTHGHVCANCRERFYPASIRLKRILCDICIESSIENLNRYKRAVHYQHARFDSRPHLLVALITNGQVTKVGSTQNIYGWVNGAVAQSECESVLILAEFSEVQSAYKQAREVASVLNIGRTAKSVSQDSVDLAHAIQTDIDSFLGNMTEAAKRRVLLGAIPTATKRELFERYGKVCIVPDCRTTDNISIDHIMPVSLGGTHDIENLQPMCRSCNSRKGNREQIDYRLTA